MRKIYISAIALVCCSMASLTSCVDDLDTKPLTEQTILADKAWSDPNSYEYYTAKIYSAYAISGNAGAASGDIVSDDQGVATFTRAYWNLQELPTDECVIAWSDGSLNSLQFNQWGADCVYVQVNYNRMNIINAFCNEFLNQTTDDKLNSRGLTADQIAAVHVNRAEVRALRALSYYILLDFYANVPFTDETSGIGAYMPEQKGRDFLFPWIEKELKECMPELPAKSSENYGKINRYVAQMILANLYMNAEVYGQGNRYDDAITSLTDIIDNGGYSLENNYQWNFNADNNLSSEIIFPICYDGNYAQTYGGTTYLMAAAWGSDMNPGSSYGLSQSWSGTRAPGDLSRLFTDDDSRALFYKDKRTQDAESWMDFTQGYSVVKYTNLTRDGKPGSNSVFADTDWPFYRLADACLLYVEAVKRGGNGDVAKAISLYNKIEERAYKNKNHNIASLDDLSMESLLDERARELYWEGHRRTDLIRFNSFTDNKNWSWKNGVFAGTKRIDSKYNLYPLPSTDLTANSNLKQNPGY